MISVRIPPDPREQLEQAYSGFLPVYEEVIENLARHIRTAFAARKPAVTVKYRVKEFSSWYTKVLRAAASEKNLSGSVTVNDVLGIRIVCPFLEEVELVSDILKELFRVHEFEVKGANYPSHYFGYESVHFLIHVPGEFLEHRNLPPGFTDNPVCEVQVRTILQEAWAEVEHELVYKSDFSPLDEPLKRKLAAINANLTLSDIMFQEIRDYQKNLHSALKQRRRDFYSLLRRESPVVSKPPVSVAGSGSAVPRETVDSLLLKGLIAHNDGRFTEAAGIYTEILKREVRKDISSIILTHRGMAYFSGDMFTRALDDFNGALELDPGNTKARYYRAVHARMNGRFKDALKDLEECILLEPYNPEYLTARAETHAASGDFERASSECSGVLRIDPSFKPAARLLKELEEM